MKESPCNCIIPAVTLAAYTARETVSFQELLKDITRLLTSSVKMAQGISYPAPPGDSHLKRIAHKLGSHSWAKRPAHNLATKKVNYHCQVQPALHRPDIGNIPHQFLVRSYGCKITIQRVLGYWLGVPRVCGSLKISSGFGT
jgi:hypothetical protein